MNDDNHILIDGIRYQLTDLFDGATKPARPGVYRRILRRRPHYSSWNGQYWCEFAVTLDRATRYTYPSRCQSLPWQGLSEDPALRTKPQQEPPKTEVPDVLRLHADGSLACVTGQPVEDYLRQLAASYKSDDPIPVVLLHTELFTRMVSATLAGPPIVVQRSA